MEGVHFLLEVHTMDTEKESNDMTTNDTAPATLLHMLTGYWITQVIYVAAKLGIADLLERGPRTSDELAMSTGTHAPSLYRLLRALANLGVFEEDETGYFRLTPIGQCLVSSTPGSMCARAITGGEEWYRAWGDLLYSVQTGETAFDHVFGVPFFQYLTQNAAAATIFNDTMAASTAQAAAAVIAAYDFSWAKTIVDVGGGNGTLIASILNANPQARGILLDTPQVTESARTRLVAAGLAGRCDVVAGDLFEAVPSGGDVYLLSWIIHDWDDERSIAILKNCHRAMAPDGRLLLIEQVVPRANEPSMSKLYDLHMLVLASGGGRERTEVEYRTLLDTAGFRLTTIIPTQVPRSIIEGVHA
jgi:SAM-dependent methyltransferase